MIKNLALGIIATTLATACSEPSSSSDSSTTPALESDTSETLTDIPADDSSSSGSTTTDTNGGVTTGITDEIVAINNLPCVDGQYDFRTDSDGRFHFDAIFDGNGNVVYNINGTPRGTYTVSNSSIAFVGPFGPNFSDATLVWTTNGCVATELRGESLGGEASLTATRR